ncbi:ABC multidrug transporter [Hirsutella rhossiliensis]|uniref:ABC multidrug transporter n=1 Tax=Hirsutella rhossiliensis TaxID=111463 RepID=A0A9P8N2P5_9HYPO|nr:ABC multidrug transporter [Hirsutella rhossiliensis]KAH0965822.1 ABC multidrug transporter [Hirsutella rhossiliensis]
MEPGMIAVDNSSAGRCDESSGPAASGCQPPRFDLTLFFEQSVLTVGPCVLLLLILLPRAAYLSRVKPKVLRHPIGVVKIIAHATVVLLYLALLVTWSRQHRGDTPVPLVAATLGFVNALALSCLSYLEHRRSVRPSSVILVYLVFSCAFDALQCRTLWLLGRQLVAPLFSATLACKLLVPALELVEKRHMLLPPWAALAPETTSSVINRGVFWWLNGLLLRGFRATLSADELYPLDHGLKSRPLLGKLPFLIKRVILYIQQERQQGDASRNVGFALVGATGLVHLGTAILRSFYQQNLFRSLTMIRGSLVSLIYVETLSAGAALSRDPDTAALTLVGPDVMAITRSFETLHEIWANPIEIALAIWLLARELGAGCIGPAVAVIVCTIIMSRLSTHMGPAMKAWNESIQRRI